MSNSLVSVIVPTYNRAYCLEKTIDSVLAQTHTALEIIVIDDGSSDNTPELFAERYASEPRIKYFSQANGGLPGARNAGIRRATGKYIAFCDSDDIWLPHKLAVQVACLDKYAEVGLAWTDLTAVDPDGKILFERYTRIGYSTWSRYSMSDLFSKSESLSAIDPTLTVEGKAYFGDIFTPMIVGAIINIPTVIVTRERLEQVGLFNESMKVGEDYDFDLRACCAGQVAFIDVVSIQYRVGAPDQLTRPELMVDQAKNSLRTLHPIIKAHRDRIKLTDAELNKVLAGRYRWLGQSEFDAKNFPAARAAFWLSLRHGARQTRLLMLLIMTFLPASKIDKVRLLYRRVKQSIG